MKGLPVAWRQACLGKLTSSALVVVPCIGSVWAVVPQ